MDSKVIKLRHWTNYFIRVILFIGAFTACDVLEPDTELPTPDPDFIVKEIHIPANSSSVIDLASSIQTGQAVKLAISSGARYGSLEDLGSGLVHYSPRTGSSSIRDGFEYTIFSDNNTILKKDSVIIFIENDSTKLPCSIYPVDDYVYNVIGMTQIDVTDNDIICNDTVTVSVHHPSSNFPPYHGTATVTGNKIQYTPGPSFSGSDKIVYKLSSNHNSVAAYGIVYITNSSPCNLDLKDDQFEFIHEDTVTKVLLPVLRNDSICLTAGLQTNIADQPLWGTLEPYAEGYIYHLENYPGEDFTDHFYYEICLNGVCDKALVEIRFSADSAHSDCVLKAQTDSMDITAFTIPVVYLDVLNNDSICGDLASFTITLAPHHGQATVSDLGNGYVIGYEPDYQNVLNDSLEYKICNDSTCSRAKVFVKREK